MAAAPSPRRERACEPAAAVLPPPRLEHLAALAMARTGGNASTLPTALRALVETMIAVCADLYKAMQLPAPELALYILRTTPAWLPTSEDMCEVAARSGNEALFRAVFALSSGRTNQWMWYSAMLADNISLATHIREMLRQVA
jgi:hypothetical protein